MVGDKLNPDFKRRDYKKERLGEFLENFPNKKIKVAQGEKEGLISGLLNTLTRNSVEIIGNIGKGIQNTIEHWSNTNSKNVSLNNSIQLKHQHQFQCHRSPTHSNTKDQKIQQHQDDKQKKRKIVKIKHQLDNRSKLEVMDRLYQLDRKDCDSSISINENTGFKKYLLDTAKNDTIARNYNTDYDANDKNLAKNSRLMQFRQRLDDYNQKKDKKFKGNGGKYKIELEDNDHDHMESEFEVRYTKNVFIKCKYDSESSSQSDIIIDPKVQDNQQQQQSNHQQQTEQKNSVIQADSLKDSNTNQLLISFGQNTVENKKSDDSNSQLFRNKQSNDEKSGLLDGCTNGQKNEEVSLQTRDSKLFSFDNKKEDKQGQGLFSNSKGLLDSQANDKLNQTSFFRNDKVDSGLVESKKEETKGLFDNKQQNQKSLFGDNANVGDQKSLFSNNEQNQKSLFSNNEQNQKSLFSNNEQNQKSLFDNKVGGNDKNDGQKEDKKDSLFESTSLFGNLNNKDNQNKEEKKEEKGLFDKKEEEKEKKVSLFGNSEGGLFKREKKEEEKQRSSLFGNDNKKEEEKKEQKHSLLFGNLVSDQQNQVQSSSLFGNNNDKQNQTPQKNEDKQQNSQKNSFLNNQNHSNVTLESLIGAGNSQNSQQMNNFASNINSQSNQSQNINTFNNQQYSIFQNNQNNQGELFSLGNNNNINDNGLLVKPKQEYNQQSQLFCNIQQQQFNNNNQLFNNNNHLLNSNNHGIGQQIENTIQMPFGMNQPQNNMFMNQSPGIDNPFMENCQQIQASLFSDQSDNRQSTSQQKQNNKKNKKQRLFQQ